MPAPDHNDGTRGKGIGNKGGFGQSGKGHEYSGTSRSGALAGRPQLNVDFDLDNLGMSDAVNVVGGILAGTNPFGIAASLGLSSLGFSLGDLANLDFGSGKPGVVSGKGPGGSGTGGGPGGPARPTNPGIPTFGPTAPATEPASAEALRQSADIQNYLSDLQRIALGQSDSRAALDRFGVSPEQAMFDYRESFPEFGDSMSNLSLAEIIKRFGNMSPNPEPYAEGGRVGENLTSRGDERVRPRPDTTSDSVSTDLARFAQMLNDLMMTGTSEGASENPFGAPDKPRARRPLIPGGLIPQTGSPFYGGDAEAFGLTEQFDVTAGSPLNIIPDAFDRGREAFDNRITPPVAPAESSPEFGRSRDLISALTEAQIANRARQIGEDTPFPDSGGTPQAQLQEALTASGQRPNLGLTPNEAQRLRQSREDTPFPDSGGLTSLPTDIPMPDVPSVSEMGMNEDIAEEIRRFEEMGSSQDRFYIDQYRRGSQDEQRIAYYVLRSQGLSPQDAKNRVDGMTPDELGQMGSMGFKNGGETRRPAPGLLQDNLQPNVTMEAAVRDRMESRGLTQEEAVKELQAIFRKTYPMSETVPDYSFAGGGSVRGRRDALPMVEGDHVVPAHAVKGNEGGLAALSKKLMGNKNYDGMIRGPGGPREDAIKTRVYAAGGGISGKMDNLQNPFNSVPARVSDKEYVIPRQAITNLGMMNGAREGDANKAGQDIIYQLVENLKRKA